jgi:hypothetical protein
VAFFNKLIAERHAKLAAYERELIGLVHVVCHWRPYLWGCPFLIKTDHFCLKIFLDQHLSTILQHQWASKLLGFQLFDDMRQEIDGDPDFCMLHDEAVAGTQGKDWSITNGLMIIAGHI